MSCVNTSSKEFKKLLDEVDISSPALELIIHKIQNSEHNDRYPTKTEVEALLEPKSFVGDANMIKLWRDGYSKPINSPTEWRALQDFNRAANIFGESAVKIIEKRNGTFDVVVGKPIIVDAIEDSIGIHYNGEERSVLQGRINDAIRSLDKTTESLSTALDMMDRARAKYSKLPLNRRVGALRSEAKRLNKEYNISIKVDDEGNIISNKKTLDEKLTILRDPGLADRIEQNWNYRQAEARQAAIEEDLHLTGRDKEEDYFKSFNEVMHLAPERATRILKSLGITLDNSLLEEALENLDTNNPYHMLLEQMVDILKKNNMPVRIVSDSTLDSIAARVQDSSKTATVRFNPTMLLPYLFTRNASNLKGEVQRILTHELVHALTSEVLTPSPSMRKYFNFDAAQTEFSDKVWDLYNKCREHLKGTEWYGMQNPREFVAEALTNREFQVTLSEIKLGETNAFKKFVNFLTNLFNKIFKEQGIDISNSVLEEIISVSQDYFEYANRGINKDLMDKDNFDFSKENTRIDRFEEDRKTWSRYSNNGYEVSSAGDKRFSALNATFKKGTIIEGVDVGGRTIEDVYQSVIKKSRKGQPPAEDSIISEKRFKDIDFSTVNYDTMLFLIGEKTNFVYDNREENFYDRGDLENFSYYEGYLPLWKKWAKQNPELIEELKVKSAGKTLTDKFANTRVSQSRALADILNESQFEESTQEAAKSKKVSTKTATYGVTVDPSLKKNWAEWQQKNPNGIVAYRVNWGKYNTPEEAKEGRIGNPFSETSRDADTVEQFFQWLVTGNNFGEAKATEEYRQAIIDKILSTETPNILYYKELNRPSHATVLGYLIKHKELLKPAENTEEVTELNETPIQDPFIKRQQARMAQLDALLNDKLLTASEVRHMAEKVAWWLSDHITELQRKPGLASTVYGDRFEGKDFSAMSRADVVRTIGVENMVNLHKLNWSNTNNDYDDLDTMDKMDAYQDNWEALMMLAQSTLLENEGFSFVQDTDGKTLSVNEDLNADADNYNESNEQSDVEETEGNLQEHWQIESKCQDVLNTMSPLVRSALRSCIKIDKEGNPEIDEFGLYERVNARDATNSILRWSRGSLTLNDMISKLQEKQKDNPWIKTILDRLADTTGKEADFQSQFFSTFCKHFQPYSVVIKEKGKYKSVQVNENPALKEAMTQVTTQYKIGEHPLFTTEGINKKSFEELSKAYESLEKFKHSDYDLSREVYKDEAATTLGYISNLLGYYVTSDMVKNNLTKENYTKMYSALYYIVKSLRNNLDNTTYEPFKFKAKDSINGNIREFLKPITESLEDTAVSAFYSNGKMYQSYITPSYMTKLMQKFNLEGEAYNNFLMEEFGNSWFHEGDDVGRGWRNGWLRLLATDAKTKEIFKHKVQLDFNKNQYMKTMDEVQYTLSLLTEYFSEPSLGTYGEVAWFRVPMLSNKPSSEFIRFWSYRGAFYKESITYDMMKFFNQELSRIQTVMMRNLDKSDPRYIKNFDKNGRKFCFLDFMNDYLTGDKKNSELGKLLHDKLEGNKVNEDRLYDLAKEVIYNTMDKRAKDIVDNWVKAGILEGAKNISGIGDNDAMVRENLENFVWNDVYAAMNITELTVTDIAYYKDAEDLQKRFAQIHSPGIRANTAATDYEGHLVSDGKTRTFYLKDFDNFISNVIDNVGIVFDRKIAEAPKEQKAALRALKESLVGKDGAYRHINVADAQGYASPTSYRKKAFLFGKWSKKSEEVYQKLKKGTYNYSDLQTAFQPLKPFVYSWHEMSSGVKNAPLETLKVGVQNKNSEYLLIMADAILHGENTGKPNLLRAIYEVMEESHFDEDGNYKTDGIDTVQFESTVKAGLHGTIDLNKYLEDPNGEAKAKAVMEASIYKTVPVATQRFNEKTGDMEEAMTESRTSEYNDSYVDTLSLEDYSLQQEVPEHFKDHVQVHGSQIRYIIPSELAIIDSQGNEATYEVEGRKLTAGGFKKEYEDTVAANIEDSINELSELLHLDSFNRVERDVALSKILQKEILSDARYGADLLQACSIDKNGNFRIPLGDPIQSRRVEQLINSIIKNRINKQEIAGGPVVQVSNYGTSRELNIRFKDRNGGLLKTRKEFKGTDEEFKQYIKENQGGIAYYEVYAPIYTNSLFSQFADKNGNINIEAIEAVDPDLLKMVGYRIPTEAKYSAAPMKIVGFLPREAGDGIMMPYDITLLTGSD